MKLNSYTLKLAAAIAMMVASVALAAPPAEQKADTPSESDVIILKPGDLQTLNLDEDMPQQPVDSHHAGAPQLSDGAMGSALIARPEDLWAMAHQYWIGVQCARLSAALAAQLDIPPGQGVLVAKVVPDGPAAKAGIVENDILLKGNGLPIENISRLTRLVQEAKEAALSFELIRKGQRQTVAVTPEKNPYWNGRKRPTITRSPLPPEQLDRFYQWYRQQQPGQVVGPRMRLRFMRPGIILPKGAPIHPTLPGGMSITIMKQGDQPTQITVKRGKDVWNVDESGIDQLPDDVRPHVERMLSGTIIAPEMGGPRLDYFPDWAKPGNVPNAAEIEAKVRERTQQQIERMNRRLEELHEMVKGLREQSGPQQKK